MKKNPRTVVNSGRHIATGLGPKEIFVLMEAAQAHVPNVHADHAAALRRAMAKLTQAHRLKAVPPREAKTR